jgi:hypothetical protein
LCWDRSVAPAKWVAAASVESLDLSTMRWSAAGCMPSLPDPRAYHSVSCRADGRVVVFGGYNAGGADTMLRLRGTALQWLPGTDVWSALPDLPAARNSAASVRLLDGRTMLIGGYDDDGFGPSATASVWVLAADNSAWFELPQMMEPRSDPAAACLPCGKVLVAGGQSDFDEDDGGWDGEYSDDGEDTAVITLNSAELWDPATQQWTALPPMADERHGAAACVLPSGRVAVVGGAGIDGVDRKDGEVYDPVKREWEPLGAEMAGRNGTVRAAAVQGGVVLVGSDNMNKPNELYDEESGRWFQLPHAMVQPRCGAGLVSVPAAALKLNE